MKRSFLDALSISGFKSFGTQDVASSISLKQVNVLIGANGAGKSCFASFFNMLGYMVNGSLQHFVAENGGASEILHFGSKKTPVMSAKLSFKNENHINNYSFSLSKGTGDRLLFSEESLGCNEEHYNLNGDFESYLSNDVLEHNNERALKNILKNCKVYQFHDTSKDSFLRSQSKIDDCRILKSNGGNIASILYLLKSSQKENYAKYYQRIIDKVRYVFPQFDNFELFPDAHSSDYVKLLWKSKDDTEYVMNASQLSDGTLRFIALATLFLQPTDLLPNVIIVDEPELGLHPAAIEQIPSMIMAASQNSQIIIATQSERLLDSINDAVSDVNILVVDYDKQHKSTVLRSLQKDEIRPWLEDYTISQVWGKNVFGGRP